MGEPKLLLPLGAGALLDRALAAGAAYPRVVVAGPAVLAALETGAAKAGITVVPNDAPERGMSHSLRLADAAIADRQAALVVLLGDTPLVDADLVARVLAARDGADVAFPVRRGRPGHPVVFGPRVRALIAELPDGDTLRLLRDDPRFRRARVPVDDERPFLDVDTADDIARARTRMMETPAAPAKS
jgi:CTP:molybdopterin cytidylyltransferase MocA